MGLLMPISAAGNQDNSCEAVGDGSCGTFAMQMSKDQMLLQLDSAKAVIAKRRAAVAAEAAGSAGSACTNIGEDPWSTGVKVACCLGAHLELGPWSGAGAPWSWLCRPSPAPAPPSAGVVGYPSTGLKKAANMWCQVDIPPADWNLKSCPASGTTKLKVLSYNLFWWNLFDRHSGSDRSAGRLIARTGGEEKYDVMGFQECDDRWRVLRDAGLNEAEYEAIDGGRAIAVAYRKTKWTLLDHDSVDVGEDSHEQYYGKRSAMWVRLRNAEGKTVFFMNHHGPLKVSQGGGCTGSATALNIMKVIGENAQSGDVIVLVGDFNAALGSSRIQELERRLTKVHSGYIFGGVDHVFSNCGARGTGQTLEKGDGHYKSDHNALSASFEI